MQTKMGGKYHLRLNIGERPIANKYREGKMKRTLKRELNSTWNCQKGNACNQYCSWEISPSLRDALFQGQVNIDLTRGKKRLECSPSGCYRRPCCLGLDRGMQYFWGSGRLLKRRGRQHADYYECQEDRLVFLHQYFGCWRNGFKRPVLKHGPRSLTCMRVFGWQTLVRNESEIGGIFAPSTGLDFFDGSE